MATEVFSQEETGTLRTLLEKVKAAGGFWPDEATMRLAHGTVSRWATELVIDRRNKNHKPEILLAKYGGGAEEFRGLWHIPGGYDTFDLGIPENCNVVAGRELGIGVRYICTLDVYKWEPGEHPYGRPLSVFTYCEAVGQITQTEKLCFFQPDSLPARMVEPHRRFIIEHYGQPRD